MRVPDLDPEGLLRTPTTAALAALAGSDDEQRRALLVQAADVIGASRDQERRITLLGATATLASIVLPRPIIKSALKEAAMPVPVRDTPLGRELFDFLGRPEPSPAAEALLYAVACRYVAGSRRRQLKTWEQPPAVGQPLPTLPLWLADDLAVPLELEASYEETCRVLRIT